MKATITGGKNLQKILQRNMKAESASMSYGFYPEATYPEGTFVAEVAQKNEFGQGNVPERPFFRHANSLLDEDIKKGCVGIALEKSKTIVSNKKLRIIGNMAVNKLRSAIVGRGIEYTPNAPSTIDAKGSSKPLVDTDRLIQSATFKIEN